MGVYGSHTCIICVCKALIFGTCQKECINIFFDEISALSGTKLTPIGLKSDKNSINLKNLIVI